MLYNTELVVILKWDFFEAISPYMVVFVAKYDLSFSHYKGPWFVLPCHISFSIPNLLYTISKRMSATVTKTYDDKKETVVTEISNLYLTSNKLLLRKSYPCPEKKLRIIFFLDQNQKSSL